MSIITNNATKGGQALAALKAVVDPEIGLNIIDLGLIRQIDFEETTGKVYVLMTLTTQFCPMGESIVDAVQRVLENEFAGAAIVVDLSFQPAWNYDQVSEEGKIFLNN